MNENAKSLDEQMRDRAFARMARIDPPRAERSVRLRVVCKPEIHALCGKILRRGENVVTVYASQVREFTDQIDETPADIRARAEEELANQLETWKAGGGSDDDFPGSLQAIIRRAPKARRGPFELVEVLEGEAGREARIAELQAELDALQAPRGPAPGDEPSTLGTVATALPRIREEQDEATLRRWLTEEADGQDRSTITNALEARLAELSDED